MSKELVAPRPEAVLLYYMHFADPGHSPGIFFLMRGSRKECENALREGPSVKYRGNRRLVRAEIAIVSVDEWNNLLKHGSTVDGSRPE